jgi:hypothetical protein
MNLLGPVTSGSASYEVGRVDKFNQIPDRIHLKEISEEMTRLIRLMGGVQEVAEYAMWYLARWCLMEIVYHTPVETGYAASMWTVTPHLGRKRVAFIIANNVPYILYLEYGHSTQAPAGMVRITFFKARTYIHYIYTLILAEVQKGARSVPGGKGERFSLNRLPTGGDFFVVPGSTATKLMIDDLRIKLEQLLPLDKPVETKNASAWLAMHTEDPRQYSPGVETMIAFDIKREAKSLEHVWRQIAHVTGRRHAR